MDACGAISILPRVLYKDRESWLHNDEQTKGIKINVWVDNCSLTISTQKQFLDHGMFFAILLKLRTGWNNTFFLPSPDGVPALLDAGLAGVGEAAGTGEVTDSAGVEPAWGEERAGPEGTPPILLCLGDRGLCALGDNLGAGNTREREKILLWYYTAVLPQ